MKVEFNANGLSASIGGDDNDLARKETNGFLVFFKREKALVLGLLALLTALLSLPFGLYIEISLNLVKTVAESKLSSWGVALLVISITVAAISLALATAATVFFKKEKTAKGKYGLSAAIAAIAVSLFCLTLSFVNIL